MAKTLALRPLDPIRLGLCGKPLKHGISQKICTSWFMLPDSKVFSICLVEYDDFRCCIVLHPCILKWMNILMMSWFAYKQEQIMNPLYHRSALREPCTLVMNRPQGFFSKFLMGGLKIFCPRWSPKGTKSDGGGLAWLTEAETGHLMQN